MSSRLLKKIHGGPEKELKKWECKSDDAENDILEYQKPVNNVNPFVVLQQSDNDNDIENESLIDSTLSPSPNVAAEDEKKKKKRRKRRPKQSKKRGNNNGLSDAALLAKYSNTRMICAPLIARHRTNKSLLSVDLRHISQFNELRRIFGKEVVKYEKTRGRRVPCLRKLYMVTLKDCWPLVPKNLLSMKQVRPPDYADSSSELNLTNAEDKIKWFSFEHSAEYQSVQQLFFTAVDRLDSDFLLGVVRRCPYHVDSLIQLSEICQLTEDFGLSTEFIERAVLILESSMHINFNIAAGNCRLDYRIQENRAFFIVLFKLAKSLEARACCRTALEVAKFVLSLNPELDPLAMVLVLDYYSVRCNEFGWLIKFYEEYEGVHNLSQLPNMCYSYAVALFCVHGECEKSNNAMQYAVLMFPSVVRPLLEELSVDGGERIEKAQYFITNQSMALFQLVCLYICRAKILWRHDNIVPWLLKNINVVLDRVENNDEIIHKYALVRAAQHLNPPRTILRHVILSDFKERVPLVQFINKEKSILTYDPLPPIDSINLYEPLSASSSNTSANYESVAVLVLPVDHDPQDENEEDLEFEIEIIDNVDMQRYLDSSNDENDDMDADNVDADPLRLVNRIGDGNGEIDGNEEFPFDVILAEAFVNDAIEAVVLAEESESLASTEGENAAEDGEIQDPVERHRFRGRFRNLRLSRSITSIMGSLRGYFRNIRRPRRASTGSGAINSDSLIHVPHNPNMNNDNEPINE